MYGDDCDGGSCTSNGNYVGDDGTFSSNGNCDSRGDGCSGDYDGCGDDASCTNRSNCGADDEACSSIGSCGSGCCDDGSSDENDDYGDYDS